MKTNNKTLRIEELINDSINSNQFNEESTSKVRYDYFIKKKEMLIKKFNKLCVRIEGKIAKSYNKNFAVRIIFQAKKEYKDLIPRIPYFGGIINPFNEIIIIVAQMAAVHKSMKQNGKSAEETVLIFYDLVDDLFKKTPKLFLWFGQKFVFSLLFIKLMQRISQRMSVMNSLYAHRQHLPNIIEKLQKQIMLYQKSLLHLLDLQSQHYSRTNIFYLFLYL